MRVYISLIPFMTSLTLAILKILEIMGMLNFSVPANVVLLNNIFVCIVVVYQNMRGET